MSKLLIPRRSLLLAAPALILSRSLSHAQIVQFSGAAAGTTYPDGKADAPAGRARYPHLLDVNSPRTQTYGLTYVTRPPWNVPGVDYPVGVNATLTIATGNPTIFRKPNHQYNAGDGVTFYACDDCTLPSTITEGQIYYVISSGLTTDNFQVAATVGGASIDTSSGGMVGSYFYALQDPWPGYPSTGASNLAAQLIAQVGSARTIGRRTISITGSNATMSGWDFSVHGGIGLYINTTGITVENCYFLNCPDGTFQSTYAPSTPYFLFQLGFSGSNHTVRKCIFDGNGIHINASTVGVVHSNSYGDIYIEHNYIKNGYAENLTLGNCAHGDVYYHVRYNVIQDSGLGQPFGAHGDWVQLTSNSVLAPGITQSAFEFNLWISAQQHHGRAGQRSHPADQHRFAGNLVERQSALVLRGHDSPVQHLHHAGAGRRRELMLRSELQLVLPSALSGHHQRQLRRPFRLQLQTSDVVF